MTESNRLSSIASRVASVPESSAPATLGLRSEAPTARGEAEPVADRVVGREITRGLTTEPAAAAATKLTLVAPKPKATAPKVTYDPSDWGYLDDTPALGMARYGGGYSHDDINTNCGGYALGFHREVIWSYAPDFVPQGARRISPEEALGYEPKGEHEVVALVSLWHGAHGENGYHVMFRDAATPRGEWNTKLGIGPGIISTEDPRYMGHYVAKITDPTAHFAWYWEPLNPGETTELRAFVVDRSKVELDGSNVLK